MSWALGAGSARAGWRPPGTSASCARRGAARGVPRRRGGGGAEAERRPRRRAARVRRRAAASAAVFTSSSTAAAPVLGDARALPAAVAAGGARQLGLRERRHRRAGTRRCRQDAGRRGRRRGRLGGRGGARLDRRDQPLPARGRGPEGDPAGALAAAPRGRRRLPARDPDDRPLREARQPRGGAVLRQRAAVRPVQGRGHDLAALRDDAVLRADRRAAERRDGRAAARHVRGALLRPRQRGRAAVHQRHRDPDGLRLQRGGGGRRQRGRAAPRRGARRAAAGARGDARGRRRGLAAGGAGARPRRRARARRERRARGRQLAAGESRAARRGPQLGQDRAGRRRRAAGPGAARDRRLDRGRQVCSAGVALPYEEAELAQAVPRRGGRVRDRACPARAPPPRCSSPTCRPTTWR